MHNPYPPHHLSNYLITSVRARYPRYTLTSHVTNTQALYTRPSQGSIIQPFSLFFRSHILILALLVLVSATVKWSAVLVPYPKAPTPKPKAITTLTTDNPSVYPNPLRVPNPFYQIPTNRRFNHAVNIYLFPY